MLTDLAPGLRYQGLLIESSEPVNTTRQMEFQLDDAESDGNQVGATITQDVSVNNEQFNVTSTWDPDVIDGRALWLQVRAQYSNGAFFSRTMRYYSGKTE